MSAVACCAVYHVAPTHRHNAITQVLTGAGKYFTSGNDLTATLSMMGDGGDPARIQADALDRFKRFATAFIECAKIIVRAHRHW